MSDDDLKIEMHPHADFAQVAEALGCTTAEIFAAIPLDGKTHAIYQPGATDANYLTQPAYRVVLEPDADGILRRASVDEEIPEFFEKVINALQDREGGSGTR